MYTVFVDYNPLAVLLLCLHEVFDIVSRKPNGPTDIARPKISPKARGYCHISTPPRFSCRIASPAAVSTWLCVVSYMRYFVTSSLSPPFRLAPNYLSVEHIEYSIPRWSLETLAKAI